MRHSAQKWTSLPLSHIAKIERTAVFPENIRTGTTYVGLENMTSSGTFVGVGEVATGELASSKFAFTDKHILYGKLRPYLAKIACPPFPGVCSTDILPILPGPDVDRRFLLHFLRQPQMVDYASSKTTGANLPRLSPAALGEFEIPLPPLSEQKRIADILDKADTIRRKRQEAIGALQSCKVAAFHEIFGDPLLNSRNWDRAPLGELLESIESGISPRCLDRPVSGGEWGILKLGAVTWCEYDWTDNKALPETINPDPSIEVQQGDLLFTRKNTHELVAATAFVYQTPPRLMFPDLIFRLRLKTNAPAFPEYLWGLLTYPSKRRQVQSLAGGAAGSMPNISKSRLLQQSVEVPPKNLQESYVKFLHRLHKTRQTTDISHMSCVDLFHSLVQRAFNGEL